MKISRLLAGVCVPLMVAACSTFPGSTYELEELRSVKPVGSPFTQALTAEYKAFAEAEMREYDWLNSQLFARKGLQAAQGTAVEPEDPSNWSIDDKKAEADIIAGRKRLMEMLTTSAPSRSPALTATAQVKYECWVEQQDEGWETDAIAACRNDFMAALDALGAPGKPAAAAAPAPAATAARQEQFLLFFDFNSPVVSHDASRILAEVVKMAKTRDYRKLVIVGHTDTSGSAAYNAQLALRRAEAVKKALVAAGLPADRMFAEGRGKSEPLVSTGDGVKEPQNRRVVVTMSD